MLPQFHLKLWCEDFSQETDPGPYDAQILKIFNFLGNKFAHLLTLLSNFANQR